MEKASKRRMVGGRVLCILPKMSLHSSGRPNEILGYDEREDEWIKSTLILSVGIQSLPTKTVRKSGRMILFYFVKKFRAEWKAVVKFGNPNGKYNWGWQLVPIGECDMNKDILLWIDMEIANCEVIGNIFDNEDLECEI